MKYFLSPKYGILSLAFLSVTTFLISCLIEKQQHVATGFSWQPDKVYRYSLSYRSEATTTAFSMASGSLQTPISQSIDTAYEAILEQQLIGMQDEDIFDLWLRFLPENNEAAIELLLSVSRKGEIKSLTFDNTATAQQQQSSRVLLALLQILLPEHTAVESWDTHETDLIGHWPVSYKSSGVFDDTFHFIKSYHGGKTENLDMQRSGEAEGMFSLSQNCLQELTIKMNSEFYNGHQQLATDQTTLLLRLQSIEPAEKQAAEHLAHFDRLGRRLSGLTGEDTYAALWRQHFQQSIADVELSDILEAYQRDSYAGGLQTLQLSEQLYAFLQLEPERAARQCWLVLMALEPSSPAFSSIAANLSSVGHEAAQTALSEALQAFSDSPKALKQLVPYLAMVKHPNEKSEQSLRDLVESSNNKAVVRTAQLGLGAMGKNLRFVEPHRTQRIFEEAKDNLDASKNKNFHLDVLGNIGHADQVFIVEELLGSADKALSAKALYSLRFVQTPKAQQLLSNVLQYDEDPHLRWHASQALTFQEHNNDLLQIYLVQLKKEKEIDVLRQILRNLSQFLRDDQEVRQAFKTFLEDCGHPELCTFAKGLWNISS